MAAEKPSSACLKADDLNNKMTPPLLFASMSACVNEDRYEEGFALYGIGSAYLQYDLRHVNDPLAPAQASDFQTQGFVNIQGKERLTKFQALVEERLSDQEKILNVCRQMLDLGPPAYGDPDYLVAEGTNIKSVLIKDVDRHYAWLDALKDSMACPIKGL